MGPDYDIRCVKNPGVPQERRVDAPAEAAEGHQGDYRECHTEHKNR